MPAVPRQASLVSNACGPCRAPWLQSVPFFRHASAGVFASHQVMRMQETMALAMIMTNAPSAEVVATFKEAYVRYSHLTNAGANKELVRYTTRAMVLAAEYAKQQGLFSEANYALMKAHYQASLPMLCHHHCVSHSTCGRSVIL